MDVFFKTVKLPSKTQTKGILLFLKTQNISEDPGERQGRIESVKRGGSIAPGCGFPGPAGGAPALPPAIWT